MLRFFRATWLIALCLCSLPNLALAAPPDAGSLLNQQRQPETSLPQSLSQPDEKAAETPASAETGVKILVKGFYFTTLEGLASEAELQSLLGASVGKELDFSALQALAARVTHYLRVEKGFLLAKAYLPKQDVTRGFVEISILSGRTDGKARVNVKPPSRIDQSLLEGIAQRAVPAEIPVRMEQLERAVLLMSDLPGIEAHAALEPGAVPGTTRLTIDVNEGPLISGTLIGDNYGDRYIGNWRVTGQVAANDPFGSGDQLQLSITGAEHLLQGWASYVVPLGSTGLSAEFAYAGLSYELGKELSDLDAEGYAHTFDLNVSYPFLRTRRASLWGGLGFEYQMLTDKANGETIRERDIPVGKAFLSGTSFDSMGGGGMTSATITIYQGDLDLSGKGGADALDATGPEASGSFLRGTYSLARLQHLTRHLSVLAAARGQLTADNLDSSQKFILGGPAGVRAYPVSEGSGDEGHLLTAEIRYELPFMPHWAATQLVGFFDSGWVKLHHDPWPGAVVNATGNNDYQLSGGGIGLNIRKAGTYDVRASYAHSIGDNAGRSIFGDNADSRSDHHRFWLQAVIWF